MLGKLVDRVTRRLPFSVRKHYVWPLLRRVRTPELYQRQYDDETFWRSFYALSRRCDDCSTIAPDFPELNAAFHYNAVENGIIAFLQKRGFSPERVLDVGSGTGHWIEFYSRLFPVKSIVGVDISADAVERLRERFPDLLGVSFLRGDILDVELPERSFDLISCIGVLFHIVDDEKWRDSLKRLSSHIRPGSLLVASGLFDPFTANVQFEPERFGSLAEYRSSPERACNKRVRSRRMWRSALKECGFREIVFQTTRKPRHMNTPKNNLLFAVK